MAERIVKLIVMGMTNYEGHLNPDDTITIEESDSLVTINIRNSSWREPSPDQLPLGEGTGAAGAPAAVGGVGTVTNPEGSPAAESVLVRAEDVSVEELKGLLRDKDLKVSGSKAELIKRLNEAE